MPAREKQHLFDYLDLPSYQILSALRSGTKTFTELASACSLSKSNFNERLEWLIVHGLVKEVLTEIRKGRSKKVYTLTPTGKRILELLEEIERGLQGGVSLEEKELKFVEEELKKNQEEGEG